MAKSKKEKWIKPRHKIVRDIAYPFMYLYSKLTYGVEIEKLRSVDAQRQYLILYNHQTAFDQFFVGMAFRRPIYYMASEDIFSNGAVSALIKYLVAPIPIKKQTTDLRAVMNCLQVAKEGGSIAIAPEGNRTYSGRTEYMNPAIAPLVRKLSLPLALYRLEGGYGVQPRWSDKLRRGKMRGYVSQIIEPEQYKDISDQDLYALIKEGLYADENCVCGEFRSGKSAEYAERAIYVCPDCGLSEFESQGDILTCKKCDKKVRFLPTKQLRGEGFDFAFEFFGQWYDYQQKYINSIDVTKLCDKPIYTDVASIFEVIVYKNKKLIAKNTKICLYGDRVTLGGEELMFDKASTFTVLGRNKLNIYYDGKVYQLKGGKRFCALKYMNIYYRYKNIVSGEKDVQFLGI